ncbi:MAG: hypothetical protein H0T51_26075 [Pirellulales bacterium]|nr:hypothetical protein [Pirellulales bacterium]
MKNLLCSAAFGSLLLLSLQVVRADDGHAHGDDHAAKPAEVSAKIHKNLEQLSSSDRELAKAQKFCPVMPEVRLGEMGPPIKAVVDGQAIMVCCKGCQKEAIANPVKTLKATAALKEKLAVEAEVHANLSELGAKDRELAEAQGFCPIMTEAALGTMGTPIKVDVNGEPVFVCCKGCSKKAQANPDKTLKTVAELKEKVSAAKDIEASFASLKPSDRGLARAQGYCVVMTDSPLGSMGAPVKLMVGEEPVFLCCAGCRRKALANPDQTLETVAKLKDKVAADTSK